MASSEELVTSVKAHGGKPPPTIESIARDAAGELTIEDNGVPFDPTLAPGGLGFSSCADSWTM